VHRPIACLITLVITLFAIVRIAAADNAGPVTILVLKEHGVGNPALAQPYLDKFVAVAALENGWPGAKGQYLTTRAAADEYIRANNPHYAILSLGAFLAMRHTYALDVVGQVAVKLVGGRQYYLISPSANSLADCRGKPVATDHADDPRFIDKVVAAGAFTLDDFSLIATQRPLQTINKVLKGEAACALIDDAQLAELQHIEGSESIHTVWKSRELPPMAVVAFPNASAEERTRFQEHLSKLCDTVGESACAEVGIVDLTAADNADYSAVFAAYGK
jgi:ABC-type amino acid transport substrate-binding protein